jgi:hypothetical protein
MEESPLFRWLAGIRQTFRQTIIPDLRSDHARGQAVAAYALLGIIERKLRVGEHAAGTLATAMGEALEPAWALLRPAGAGPSWREFETRFLALWQAARESESGGTERLTAMASVIEELLRASWNPDLGIPEEVAAQARIPLRSVLKRHLEFEKETIRAHSYTSPDVAPGDRA